MGRFANATLVRLSEFLSAGYKKGVRPVKDWRDSTSVAIDLMIYSILNVVSFYHFNAVNVTIIARYIS
jgi:5-hydroxytryptamine receptor 3